MEQLLCIGLSWEHAMRLLVGNSSLGDSILQSLTRGVDVLSSRSRGILGDSTAVPPALASFLADKAARNGFWWSSQRDMSDMSL